MQRGARRGCASSTSRATCSWAWAARAWRPRSCAGPSASEPFHVLDSTHPAAVRALEEPHRPRRHALRRLLEVRDDARDALPSGLLLAQGRARSRRSPTPARSSRRSAASAASRPSSGESRRSAVATRLSRRSGSSRRRSWASTSSSSWKAPTEMQEACRDRQEPGPRARARARARLARGSRQGRRPGGERLRALAGAAPRRVDRARTARASSRRPASRPRARTARSARSRSAASGDLGAELYRWEFATAVAGTILEINPFDQPNVQEAKDRTLEVLSGHGQVPGTGTRPEGTAAVEELLAGAQPGDYIAVLAFIDPEREAELATARRAGEGHRLRRHGRPRARAICTRPASSTRAALRPGASSRSWTTRATSFRSPGGRSASAR